MSATGLQRRDKKRTDEVRQRLSEKEGQAPDLSSLNLSPDSSLMLHSYAYTVYDQAATSGDGIWSQCGSVKNYNTCSGRLKLAAEVSQSLWGSDSETQARSILYTVSGTTVKTSSKKKFFVEGTESPIVITHLKLASEEVTHLVTVLFWSYRSHCQMLKK